MWQRYPLRQTPPLFQPPASKIPAPNPGRARAILCISAEKSTPHILAAHDREQQRAIISANAHVEHFITWVWRGLMNDRSQYG